MKTKPTLYRMRRSWLDWFKLISLSVASAALVFGAYQLFAHSSYFKVNRIEVRGEHPHISDEALTRVAGIPLGKNIFSVHLYQVGQNIKRLPWIKDVQVRRIFPQGISIWVSEYVPEAVLAATDAPLMRRPEVSAAGYGDKSWVFGLKDVDLYYISSEGTLFKKIKAGDDLNFPLVSGFKKEALERFPGYYRAHLKTVMEFYRDYRNSKVDPHFMPQFIHYDLTEGIEALLARRGGAPAESTMPGFMLFVGQGDFHEKLDRLGVFIQMMAREGQNFRLIDVHVPGKVFARI